MRIVYILHGDFQLVSRNEKSCSIRISEEFFLYVKKKQKDNENKEDTLRRISGYKPRKKEVKK